MRSKDGILRGKETYVWQYLNSPSKTGQSTSTLYLETGKCGINDGIQVHNEHLPLQLTSIVMHIVWRDMLKEVDVVISVELHHLLY